MKKVFALACILFCFKTGFCIMLPRDFQSYIQDICYNKTDSNEELINGQVVPIASSIESFISLVEKVERNQTNLSPLQVAEGLLMKFSIPNLKFISRGFESSFEMGTGFNAYEITRALLNPNSDLPVMKDGTFSDNEKCALYYMLSHTINDTRQPGENGNSYNGRLQMRNGSFLSYPKSKIPREQGVLSLKSSSEHAVDFSRVLYGIVAGLKGEPTKSVNEIYRSLRPTDHTISIERDNIINIIYSVTVSDVLVEFVRNSLGQFNTFIGNGRWNSTFCPTQYKFDSPLQENNIVTYSLIRGAVDGIILGRNAKNIFQGKKLLLSQFLRMYYLNQGGVPGVDDCSVCKRRQNIEPLRKEINDDVAKYAVLYNAIIGRKPEITEDTKQRIFSAVNLMSSGSQSGLYDNEFEEIGCTRPDPTFTNPTCETPTDLFFILDIRSDRQDELQTQKFIIGNVTSGLDLGYYGSSVTVLGSRSGRGSESNELQHIAYNMSSSGCAECFASWYSPESYVQVDDETVFENLNSTLMKFETAKSTLPGVPAKVVVYFNFGNNKGSNRLKRAIKEVHEEHRDVPIYAIGREKQTLRMFVHDEDSDIFLRNQEPSILAKELLKKICYVPATFQYDECYDRTDDSDRRTTYTGYVSPNHRQYWAFYPEYFLKSFTITITFTAIKGGDIRVFYTRSYNEFLNALNKADMKETQSPDHLVQFTIKNPCKGKNVYNCRPFYFAIDGKAESENSRSFNPSCTDPNCKSSNQIIFEVKHTGIACSKGVSLMSSLWIIFGVLSIMSISKRNLFA